VGENPRGLHMMELLNSRHGFTLDSLIKTAFDPHVTAFDRLVPGLVKAWEGLDAADPRKARLAEPVAMLRGWDHRWGEDSEATSLAVFWAEDLYAIVKPNVNKPIPAELSDQPPRTVQADLAPDAVKIEALEHAVGRLETSFGGWRVPWGEINRYQRLDDSIQPHFDDAKPSIPVAFTYSEWGSLASFSAKAYPNTKKYYGTDGNSFVAAVEFGPRVKARAVTAGGESGHPGSAHFDDQAQRYVSGDFRSVYFYADELKGHARRRYHPGEAAR
jgi:acyl-homoserine-lactone acylase